MSEHIRVTINLSGTERWCITRYGLFSEFNFLDEWEQDGDVIDLDRAEVLFHAALRSVQCIQEIEGSGAKLTLQCPRHDGEVEPVASAVAAAPSPSTVCKCGRR